MQNDPRYYVNAAVNALRERDRDATVEALRILVRERPPIGSTWGPMARMAKALQEPNLAVTLQQYHIAEAPTDMARYHELGEMLMHFGRIDEAVAWGQELIQRTPDNHAAHQYVGVALATAGRADEALVAFRRALEIKPAAPETWLSLSQQKKFTPDDPDLAKLRAALDATPLFPKVARGTMLYALGKALDDLDDVDGAFNAYSVGAGYIGEELGYDPAAHQAFVDDVTANWTPDFARQLSPSSVMSDRIVFVMGLPRSGTTLTEQILVSHSKFSEGAETALFGKAALALTDFKPGTVLAANNNPRWQGDLWSRVGKAYLHLMSERFGREGRLVDKTLHHPRQLGAIAHTLPNAKFVWLRRDPGAVAWSCFRTRFAEGIEWSWSQEHMGHHFRLEDRLFAHWTKMFPDRILPLSYEKLVADPETQIPQLLAFAGLEDEPQTRNFHEVKRIVKTASVAQVRKPLYTSSVTGWRRYEKHLQPFFDAYRGK